MVTLLGWFDETEQMEQYYPNAVAKILHIPILSRVFIKVTFNEVKEVISGKKYSHVWSVLLFRRESYINFCILL